MWLDFSNCGIVLDMNDDIEFEFSRESQVADHEVMRW